MGCESLVIPPYNVGKRGLQSIKQYFSVEAKSSAKPIPVTIAVMGFSQAGKTSFIETLRSKDRKRYLTNRHEDTWFDTATKAFDIHKVEVGRDEDGRETVLRFVDFGGHDVYHVTYQLTFKESCIPVIVVSLAQYQEKVEGDSNGNSRDAVRCLFLDWISNLYLAIPHLGPPKLVLTHKDKFSPDEFNRVKQEFLATLELVWEELTYEAPDTLSKSMFHSIDAFEIGKDEDYEVFDSIKVCLHKAAEDKAAEHHMLPNWRNISKAVTSLPNAFHQFDAVYSDIKQTEEISKEQFKDILGYMHDCGEVLWYQNPDLKFNYVFTKTSSVKQLLVVLYDHKEEQKWKNRLENFVASSSGNKMVSKNEFSELAISFRKTGIVDKVLLEHLIVEETYFETISDIQVALKLLQAFKLIYGPIVCKNSSSFIVPKFSKGWVENFYPKSAEVKFQVEIMFKGLALPMYRYHQMTVAILEVFAITNETSHVKFDGVLVSHDDVGTGIVYIPKSRKVTIKAFGPVSKLALCWRNLEKACDKVLEETESVQRETKFFCPHCLIRGDDHPERLECLPWCTKKDVPRKRGLQRVTCKDEEDVPFALKYSCKFKM